MHINASISALWSFKTLLHNPFLKPSKSSVEDYTEVTLDKLPTEILLCITDHLNLVDVACLSLSNRRLRYKMGKKMSGAPPREPKIEI